MPYGGFGDPEVAHLHWRRTADVDDDRFALAQAQDRFVRHVRTRLAAMGRTEDELEQQLGYPKRGLQRKLNGHELVTMRDVIRIGHVLGGGALAALAPQEPAEATWTAAPEASGVVNEPPVPYARTIGSSHPGSEGFHSALQSGVDHLLEAARYLRRADEDGAPSSAALAESLSLLAKAANAIGAGVVERQPPTEGDLPVT